MDLFGDAHPNAFFVQIGANDGYSLDPLTVQIERREWRGIMVEPVPYVFAWLAERYGNHPRLVLGTSGDRRAEWDAYVLLPSRGIPWRRDLAVVPRVGLVQTRGHYMSSSGTSI